MVKTKRLANDKNFVSKFITNKVDSPDLIKFFDVKIITITPH